MQREGFQVAVRNVADVDQPDVDAGLIEDLAEILLEMPHVVAREETVVDGSLPDDDVAGSAFRVGIPDPTTHRNTSRRATAEPETSLNSARLTLGRTRAPVGRRAPRRNRSSSPVYVPLL
jgi:hypothetical protein